MERGTLWLLQTRVGKRTAAAAFRIATQLVNEGLITLDEALQRVSGAQLTQLTFPQFDPGAARTLLVRGTAASPGAAVGRAAFDPATAVSWASQGERAVLVRRETSPEDLEGMVASVGVLTSRGGRTSHAAVVARGMGRPCVSGAEGLEVDPVARTARAGQVEVREGDVISLDGSTGEVFVGPVPVIPSPVLRYLEHGVGAALSEPGACLLYTSQRGRPTREAALAKGSKQRAAGRSTRVQVRRALSARPRFPEALPRSGRGANRLRSGPRCRPECRCS